MILDRSFNPKNQQLTITYTDKGGNRQYYQKYLHHITTYEYDDNGEYDTWNGRKCNKVFKDSTQYKPNEFDILEYMYNLPEDLQKQMQAMYTPRLYTFDIETMVSSSFPDPQKAEQAVTSISLVGSDLSCIVFGLHQMDDEQKERLANRYLEFIENNQFAKNLLAGKLKGKTPKVLYQYFATEEDLLNHWFKVILPKVPAIAGWNSYRFDFLYLTNRYEKLFGKGELMNVLRKISPTGELHNIKWEEKNFDRPNRMMAPRHTLWLDYMDLCKNFDYLLTYESYSLDWVASAAVKANKIKYTGTLQQLYERDYEWYYYYNAVDSLLGKQITLGRASLDHYLREILVEENGPLLHLCRIKCHLDNFSLAIGVGSEIHHPRPRSALGEVVLAVAGDTGDIESLDEVESLLAVAIHHIVYRPVVVAFEDSNMQDIRADEQFLRHAHHLVFAVFVEYDDVVYIRAVA